MDILLAVIIGIGSLLYGAFFIRAVTDVRKGFPPAGQDVDRIRENIRDRYYIYH